jgi:hypothetical protein
VLFQRGISADVSAPLFKRYNFTCRWSSPLRCSGASTRRQYELKWDASGNHAMVSANVEWCRGYCVGTVVSPDGSFSLCVRAARQRASVFMPAMTSGTSIRRRSFAATGNVSRSYLLIPLGPLHNSDRPPGDVSGYLAVVGHEATVAALTRKAATLALAVGRPLVTADFSRVGRARYLPSSARCAAKVPALQAGPSRNSPIPTRRR